MELDALSSRGKSIPMISAIHDDEPHLKTPDELCRDKRRFKGHRVILLVRDPRDVAVSYYFHKTRRERRQTDESIEQFLRSPRGSLATILEYYNVWNEALCVPAATLVMRYEDLKAQPSVELARALAFVGIAGVTSDIVESAVAFASFDKMRQMERQNAFGSMRLSVRTPDDPEAYKTRRGVVGGYTAYLGAGQIGWMNEFIGERLKAPFGYRIGCHAAESRREHVVAAVET
jgi:hypothetical protein